jgi:mono/diheme cytochrome c family protein
MDYGVPADDANAVNPIAADDASLQRGEEIYISSCIDCHGKEGRGDGVAATRLNPKPADFRSENVKELSDGELFYIITNGTTSSRMGSRDPQCGPGISSMRNVAGIWSITCVRSRSEPDSAR